VQVGRWAPERGRELRTTRLVSSGETLFEARPFAAALCVESLTTHCSICFLPLDAGPADLPASRCGACQLYTLCGSCAADSGRKIKALSAHCESGECDILTSGMDDTTSRILLQIWHALKGGSDHDSNQHSVWVVRGPGITQQEALCGRKGSGDAALELVSLPHGVAGLESLDGHEDDDGWAEGAKSRQAQQSEYEEYVKCVLAFAEGAGEDGVGSVGDEQLQRALRWLSILKYNQHAISCDFTGAMLGNMLAPEGRCVAAACLK